MGLRGKHYQHILENNPPVSFFEIISENYIGTGGRPMYVLQQVAERYPIMMHGVSMSLGSLDSLNFEYLGLLRGLADRLKVPWISDHLCWTGILGRNTHDLLPVPLTEQALRHVVGRIRAVQDFMERPLVVENPSSYLEFLASSMPEHEFMVRMAEEADCGILLDVNNVYVSAFNHSFDPEVYLRAIPPERVVYHHVAGHTHKGTHILDTHSDHVVDPVWELYRLCHSLTGGRSTMVEWDEDIPPFEVVYEEVLKAGTHRRAVQEGVAPRPTPPPRRQPREAPVSPHDCEQLFTRGERHSAAMTGHAG